MTSKFQGLRATLTRDILIEAGPEAVFPLLCPVREGEWIDGWIGKAVFSNSGVAEENGVFATEHGGEDDTIWYVTRRDPAKYVIEFVYFVPREQVVRLQVRLKALAEHRTRLSVEYIRTAITEAGNEFIRNADQHFEKTMSRWEASMNHFFTTGTLLAAGH